MFRAFSDGQIHISVVQHMVLSDICCIALLLTLPGKANVDVPGPFRTGKHLEELQSGRGPEASKKNSKRSGFAVVQHCIALPKTCLTKECAGCRLPVFACTPSRGSK